MGVQRVQVLAALPQFTNSAEMISSDQSVKDIIHEVCNAHKHFAGDYDRIAQLFNQPKIEKICQALFDFCKENIVYHEESGEDQTTKSPAAILTTGTTIGGDCKHYASFIAGVLGAIQRVCGRSIDWRFRFASYSAFNQSPGHVFVVVRLGDRDIWIDPVLNAFDKRFPFPTHYQDYKIKNNSMALRRIAGFDDYKSYVPGQMLTDVRQAFPITDISAEPDPSLTPAVEDAIKMLLYYNVMNDQVQVNEQAMTDLAGTLSESDYSKLLDAYDLITSEAAAVGGFFDTIWRGIKKVTLSPARGAYLAMVALNVFGLGTKLWKAAFNADGTYYQPGKDKLKDKWQNKLGGDWSVLQSAILKGHNRPRILGIEDYATVGVAPAAFAAAAVTIIEALKPLIESILKGRQADGTGADILSQDLATNYTAPTGGGLMGWIKANPIATLGIAAVLGTGVYLLVKKKKTA